MYDILSFLCLEFNVIVSVGDLFMDQLQNIIIIIVNDVQFGLILKIFFNIIGVVIFELFLDFEDFNWQIVVKENKNEGYEKLVQLS